MSLLLIDVYIAPLMQMGIMRFMDFCARFHPQEH